MKLHVYGIVRADAAMPGQQGVGDPSGELRSVECDGVAAVVSELDDDLTLTDKDAVTHLEVLSSLLSAGPVLPLRFGTEAPDEDAVREEILARNVEELRRRLDTVDGMVELRLELRFDEESAVHELLTADPEIRHLAGGPEADMDQRVRLGEAIAEGVTALCQDRAERIVEPVLEVARAKRIEEGETAPTVVRLALLAKTEQMSAVDKVVSGLHEAAPDVDFEYVGPLPVFSFHEEVAGSGDRAPASRWGW